MTKDDKKIVRNVILFCIIFSLVFTGYRIISLMEKNPTSVDNDNVSSIANISDNNILPDNVSSDNISSGNLELTPPSPINQDNITYNKYENPDQFIAESFIADPYTDIDNMLYDAALQGDFEKVRRYIDMGANVNSIDSRGNSILFKLSLVKNLTLDQLNCINYLLIKGADPNMKNNNGYTPIIAHFSTHNFNKGFLDRLIKNNGNINIPDFDGDTPLHFAVANNNAEAVEYLLEHGANINAKNKDGITPLHIAVQKKNYNISLNLTLKGADKNTKDINGVSALDLAKASKDIDLYKIFNISSEDIEKASLLLELGNILNNNISKPGVKHIKENVDKGFYNNPIQLPFGASSIDGKFVGENPTPLMVAIYFGYNDIAKALINVGADVNKEGNRPYYSPLMLASEKSNKEMVEFLIKQGANVNYQSKTDGITAIHVASNPEIADILLKAGANVQIVSNSTCISPLQNAVINNNYDLAEVMIKHGADVNHVDCKDYKPVIANAIDTANPALVRLLINNNAGVNTEVGENLDVKVIDYAKSKGNQIIVDMINNKLQSLKPTKPEINIPDNSSPASSSLIKNNVIKEDIPEGTANKPASDNKPTISNNSSIINKPVSDNKSASDNKSISDNNSDILNYIDNVMDNLLDNMQLGE